MPQAPGPTVFRVQYQSEFGFHSMQVPTREWSPPTTGEPLGTVPRWIDDTQIDLFDMVDGFIDLLLPFFKDTVSFNNVTVLTQATPTSALVPQISATLSAKIGTAATPGWYKAIQGTLTVRDTATNIAKYVLLDSASFNDFNPVNNLASVTAVDDIFNYVTDTANAFSSQAGFRPTTYLGYFRTINERLRRAYRMT